MTDFDIFDVRRGISAVDDVIVHLTENDLGVVAGGYATWALLNTYYGIKVEDVKPSDVDIFLYDDEEATINSTIGFLLENGAVASTTSKAGNVLSYYNAEQSITYQLIKPFYNRSVKRLTAEAVLARFDLSCCRCALSANEVGDVLYGIGEPGFDKKDAVVHRVDFDPTYTLSRMAKYTLRGWRFSRYEYAKVLSAFNSQPQDARSAVLKMYSLDDVCSGLPVEIDHSFGSLYE